MPAWRGCDPVPNLGCRFDRPPPSRSDLGASRVLTTQVEGRAAAQEARPRPLAAITPGEARKADFARALVYRRVKNGRVRWSVEELPSEPEFLRIVASTIVTNA